MAYVGQLQGYLFLIEEPRIKFLFVGFRRRSYLGLGDWSKVLVREYVRIYVRMLYDNIFFLLLVMKGQTVSRYMREVQRV